MKVPLQSLDDYAAIHLPDSVPKPAQLVIGDTLIINVRSEGMVPTPERRKYSLEELVGQCNQQAPAADDLSDWLAAPPVGCETLPPL